MKLRLKKFFQEFFVLKSNKIILGSTQLGLNYGLGKFKKKISKKEREKIFKFCLKKNYLSFDTSKDYGNSEKIITKKFKSKCKIYTKFNKKNLNRSLRYFKTNKVKPICLTFHDFNDYLDIKFRSKVKLLAKKNKIKKIGVSIYSSDQFKKIENDIQVVQLPISILDRYFLNNNFLKVLKKKNIEIHARSVFFKGLLSLSPQIIKKKYPKIRKHIEKIFVFSSYNKLKPHELSLIWVNSIKYIDKIILGVDNFEQLKRNIELLNKKKPKNLNNLIQNLNKEKKINFNLSKWK